MTRAKIKTVYGIKVFGASRFVICAPHAAGDDLGTGFLARMVSRRLKGFLAVNNRYFKPTNSKAKKFPERIDDFNKLSWGSKRKKYFWPKKCSAKKEFYRDIKAFCREAKKYCNEKKAVVVYIHGMKKDGRLGVDIGAGLRAKSDTHRFHGSSRSDYYCTGVPTIRVRLIKDLKKAFKSALPEKWKVGVGRFYPGWSKRISTQYHKNGRRDDYALQLEINNELKKGKTERKATATIVANALKEVFK